MHAMIRVYYKLFLLNDQDMSSLLYLHLQYGRLE